jgi:hypothetical protein
MIQHLVEEFGLINILAAINTGNTTLKYEHVVIKKDRKKDPKTNCLSSSF